MKLIQLSIPVFCLCVIFPLAAQDKKTDPTMKDLMDRIAATQKRPAARVNTAPPTNIASLSVSTVFPNLAVAPGQLQVLTSTQDWTGADNVSISIECPQATSLQQTQIIVLWTIPSALFYTVTSLINGSAFLLPNQGGAIVPAFGNQLQIVLLNNGTTAIACDQVVAYAVVH